MQQEANVCASAVYALEDELISGEYLIIGALLVLLLVARFLLVIEAMRVPWVDSPVLTSCVWFLKEVEHGLDLTLDTPIVLDLHLT